MTTKTNMPETVSNTLAIARKAGDDLITADAKKGTGGSRAIFACVEAVRWNISERLTTAIRELCDPNTPTDDKAKNAHRKMVIGVDLFGIGEIHTDDKGKQSHSIVTAKGTTDAAGVRKWGALWSRVNASIPLIAALIQSGEAHVKAGREFDTDYELSKAGYLEVRCSAIVKPGSLTNESDMGEKSRVQAYDEMLAIGKPGGKATKPGQPTSIESAVKAAREVTGIKRGGAGNGAKGAQGTNPTGARVQVTTLHAAAMMLAACDPTKKDARLAKEEEAHARTCLAHLLRYFGAVSDAGIDADKVAAVVAEGANG